MTETKPESSDSKSEQQVELQEGEDPSQRKRSITDTPADKDVPESKKQKQGQQQHQPIKKKKSSSSSKNKQKLLQELPVSAHYQISFLHREIVTHIVTSWKHGYVVTASADGMVKFWKRTPVPPMEWTTSSSSSSSLQKAQTTSTNNSTPCLEFVKTFTAHVGAVAVLLMEPIETDLCVSIGRDDGIIKLYEVSTFDATSMIRTKIPKISLAASFFRSGTTSRLLCLAVASAVDGTMYIYNMDPNHQDHPSSSSQQQQQQQQHPTELLQIITHLHKAPITAMDYHADGQCMYSVDNNGILQVWDCTGEVPLGAAHLQEQTKQQQQQQQHQEESELLEGEDSTSNPSGTATTTTSPLLQVGSTALNKKRHGIQYQSKMNETDLYQLVKHKTYALHLCVHTYQGQSYIFVLGADYRIRIFHHETGCLKVKYDERLEKVYDHQYAKYGLDSMDYGKRVSTEREMAQTWQAQSSSQQQPIRMQVHGCHLFLPTLLGVKVIDWQTNQLLTTIGKGDASQLRFCSLCLCLGDAKIDRQMQLARGVKMKSRQEQEQLAKGGGDPKKGTEKTTVGKSTLPVVLRDVLMIATAFSKRRFYIFSQLDPFRQGEDEETKNQDSTNPTSTRDVWNEPPTAEDRYYQTDEHGRRRLLQSQQNPTDQPNSVAGKSTTAILRTSMGDIHIKLFVHAAIPKTIENFCGHAKSGYYDNVMFHRVIKGFMLQTGDPLGDGTGGESIWGGEFEDEFVRELRHDRPFTVSMANAGPNTNGSQFFITTVPTPWLDNVHTVFGRVIRGMDVCTAIENCKTDAQDKPLEDIHILNVDIEVTDKV